MLTLQIRDDEMGGACDAHGGQQTCIKSIAGETWTQEAAWNTNA